MSLLDTASLIVTPNGYKEGKLYSVIPSDGSGDMSVVRATTATRVNSAGLVELVPYNLVQYSQEFNNAAWDFLNVATITPNSTTAPDGTLTADTLTFTASVSSCVAQPLSVSQGNLTISIYAKVASGTKQFKLRLDSPSTNESPNFTATTEWQRFEFNTTTAGNVSYFYVINSDTATAGSVFIWGAQLNEGSLKDYQKTETRLNIPRLDYSNGTCPSLLVEPQRTNGQEYSEDLTQTSFWAYGAVSISANQIVSPSGILNADKVIEAATTARHELYSKVYNFTGSNACSFFIKSAGRQYISVLSGGDPSLGGATFDVVNGLVTYTSGSSNATIEGFGNGWFKCSFTTTRTGSSQIYWCFRTINATPDVQTYAGDGTSGFYLWGAQLEAGSYATSYIPTTSASVTRNADVISKTGISSLIGQTEGTLFVEVDYQNLSGLNMFLSIRPNASNKIEIYRDSGNIYGEITGSTNFSFLAAKPIGTHKIAFAYKSGSSALYIDGALIGQNTTAFTFSSTLSDLFVNQRSGGLFIEAADYKAAALWKTRLTNTQLAQLTTI